MSGSDVIGGSQLRAIVERIENVEQEIRELTEAKKEVYLEAKGRGFDVKILREVAPGGLFAGHQGCPRCGQSRGKGPSKGCLTAAAGCRLLSQEPAPA